VEKNLLEAGNDCHAIHEWRGACAQHSPKYVLFSYYVTATICGKHYCFLEPVVQAANNIVKKNTNQKDKALSCSRLRLDCYCL
jgi:hypothetical protein